MVDYKEYLASRQLQRGKAGWILLAGLGVSYVISGNFSGWNFGIAQAGWGGFLIAAIAMAIMYFSLVFSLAEMSAAIPTAGGGYSFARQAIGQFAGYITGIAVLIEYILASSAIVIFIGAAINSLFGIDGPIVYAAFYILIIGIHLTGVGEALKLMLGISGIAVFAIVLTSLGLLDNFQWANLFDIAPSYETNSSTFLPFGIEGVWAALPFAMWLFLAVEGVPLAAEEAKSPAKDIPKGIIAAMTLLIVTASLVMFFLSGAVGAEMIGNSAVPLVDALKFSDNPELATIINVLSLAGLVASFFSVVYGYSRLVFALSRAGYLPQSLSVTNEKKIPARALIIPGIFGFALSLTQKGDFMIGMAVVAATASYALMSLSHILLRLKQPSLNRPYKTPGGIVTSFISLILSLIAMVGVYFFDTNAFYATVLLFLGAICYYFIYSRSHVVAKSAEEEFAMLLLASDEA